MKCYLLYGLIIKIGLSIVSIHASENNKKSIIPIVHSRTSNQNANVLSTLPSDQVLLIGAFNEMIDKEKKRYNSLITKYKKVKNEYETERAIKTRALKDSAFLQIRLDEKKEKIKDLKDVNGYLTESNITLESKIKKIKKKYKKAIEVQVVANQNQPTAPRGKKRKHAEMKTTDTAGQYMVMEKNTKNT